MKAVGYKGPARFRGAGERGDGCALVASPAEDRQPGERDGNTLGHDQPNAAEEAYARDRDLVAVDVIRTIASFGVLDPRVPRPPRPQTSKGPL